MHMLQIFNIVIPKSLNRLTPYIHMEGVKVEWNIIYSNINS